MSWQIITEQAMKKIEAIIRPFKLDEVKEAFQVYDTKLLALEGQHKKTYVEHHCHAPCLVIRIYQANLSDNDVGY